MTHTTSVESRRRRVALAVSAFVFAAIPTASFAQNDPINGAIGGAATGNYEGKQAAGPVGGVVGGAVGAGVGAVTGTLNGVLGVGNEMVRPAPITPAPANIDPRTGRPY